MRGHRLNVWRLFSASYVTNGRTGFICSTVCVWGHILVVHWPRIQGKLMKCSPLCLPCSVLLKWPQLLCIWCAQMQTCLLVWKHGSINCTLVWEHSSVTFVWQHIALYVFVCLCTCSFMCCGRFQSRNKDGLAVCSQQENSPYLWSQILTLFSQPNAPFFSKPVSSEDSIALMNKCSLLLACC